MIWNFAKVKSASTEALSFGGLPTNMDYIITGGKEEDVVDAAFQHRRYVLIVLPAVGSVLRSA